MPPKIRDPIKIYASRSDISLWQLDKQNFNYAGIWICNMYKYKFCRRIHINFIVNII